MKTAHPASLPPAPWLSGGIRRSTTASIVAASSAVKKSQGPGRHGCGGLASPGTHGMAPLTTRACTRDGPATTQAIADPSSLRRVSDVELIGIVGGWMLARRHLMRIAGAAIDACGPRSAGTACGIWNNRPGAGAASEPVVVAAGLTGPGFSGVGIFREIG